MSKFTKFNEGRLYIRLDKIVAIMSVADTDAYRSTGSYVWVDGQDEEFTVNRLPEEIIGRIEAQDD